jgi:hypothetical protein
VTITESLLAMNGESVKSEIAAPSRVAGRNNEATPREMMNSHAIPLESSL